MADGEHTLPADEELFEQPAHEAGEQIGELQQEPHLGEQEPQHDQLIEHQDDIQQIEEQEVNVDEIPEAEQEHEVPVEQSDVAPRGIPFLDDPPAAMPMPTLYQDPAQNYYQPPQQEEVVAPVRIRNNELFQPAAYVAPVYVEQGRGSEDYSDGGADGENGPEHDPVRLDANEATVWIDSDSDNDTEGAILKQNFFLPYSDHNYDCADPLDRVNHPQEGPFPIIDGLDAHGNIVKQYMPGQDPPATPPPGDRSFSPGTSSSAILHQDVSHHVVHQHHQLPQRQVLHMNRPVGTAPPFSVGGSEYHQRVEPMQRITRDPNYRMVSSEYGMPQRPQTQRVLPSNAMIRQSNPQAMYGSPQQPQTPLGTVRTMNPMHRRPVPPHQNSAPGSYQHIQVPVPGASGVMRRPIGRMPQQLVGNRQATVRPMQVGRPMEVHERDYIDSLQPAQGVAAQPPPPPPPVQRRVADVAPHRMTQEQMQAQQQLVRQRPAAQFPVSEPQQQGGSPTAQAAQIIPANRLGANRLFVRGQAQPPTGAGVLVRARGISGTEDLLRSPQRLPSQSPQRPNESPRKFQLKVSEATYSAPIPKVSDQLPAQITEDPPEDEPTSSAAAAAMDAIHEDGPPAQLLEEETVPSRHASPIKPTPPHRMTQDEKHAHLARLAADKEKPIISSPLHQSSAPQHLAKPSMEVPPSSAPHPLRTGGHQEDTLAMVQSVFDPSKPRPPDTPKDKEAILKIADHLRFSAEKYETNKIPDSVRRRNDSQMSQGSQGHGYHHNPLAMERDDGRRKRQSLTRYDMQHPQHPHQSSSSMRPQHQPHQQQQQHLEALEAPHRSRGRPRGSTGPQRTQPIAPHRVGGGARTLQPRSQAPPARNGGADNSDSESEGIDEETWVMRCHCGMNHPTGLSLECEQCKTWQHTYCMGLKANSNTDGYLCEQCKPRRLSITKQEAIKIQRKELAKTKKANKKNKERKERRSEPPPEQPPKKSIPSSSSSQSRKSAPQYREPEQKASAKLVQLNEYSKAAAHLLACLPRTQGAEQLLEDARVGNKAKRMFVSEKVEALVTTEIILVRAVVIEMTGHISMSKEVKRQPGGGGHIFLYDGLMKDASGTDTGETQELIAIDTRRKGNDTKLTRRSCQPNCVLKHVLGADAVLGVMLVATREIPYNQEVTLPFDMDWIDNDQPLECAEHLHDMGLCPFEQKRRDEHRHRTFQRQKKDDERRRQMQADRAAMEEHRRLEDEVRREREEKMRQMGEEEEKKKREEKAALDAKKKQEREEAKKRKEAERAARQASEERKEEEPHKLSRDERLTQQAEERFRRQEAEEQRKEAQKAKALEKAEARKSKSKTPEVEDPNVPESSSAAEKQVSRFSKTLEELEMREMDDDETQQRGTKRNDSAQRTASPPAKRSRTSIARVPMPTERVSSTMKSAKKQKKDDAQFKVRAFTEGFHANAKEAIKQREAFVLPDSISENESDWVADKMKSLKRNTTPNTDPVTEAQIKQAKKLESVDRKWDEQEEAREKERKRMQKKAEKIAAAIEQDKKDAVEKKKEAKRKEREEAEKTEQAGPAPPVEAAVPLPSPVPELPFDEPMEIDEPEPQQRDATPAKSETSEVKGSREASETKEVRESRESSETKETGPKKGGAGPKKLSLEQYKQKRAVASKEEASTSGTPSSAAPPRQCFIPSTDASSTANARLANIFLDGLLPGTTPSEPSTSDASKPVETVASLSEDEPTHTQSLADRAAAVFGLSLQPSAPSAPSTSSSRPHETRVRQRSSRWNQI